MDKAMDEYQSLRWKERCEHFAAQFPHIHLIYNSGEGTGYISFKTKREYIDRAMTDETIKTKFTNIDKQ